jgi:YesN/AraC family two-component response regulator
MENTGFKTELKRFLHQTIQIHADFALRPPGIAEHESFLSQTYHVDLSQSRPLYDLVTLSGWYTNTEQIRGFLYAGFSTPRCYAWISPFSPGTICKTHSHTSIELTYIIEGRLRMRIEEEELSFNEGEFVLINSDVLHGEYLYKEDCSLICLDIDNSFFTRHMEFQGEEDYTQSLKKLINEKRSQYLYIRFSPAGDAPQTTAILTLLLREMSTNLPGKKHLSIGAVERVIDLLTKEFHTQVAKQDTADLHKALFEDIQNYVRNHHSTVTVQQIGAAFHFSPDYLNRIFRKQIGLTLSTYIQDVRLSEAMKLLRTTNLSVENIAAQIGYQNQGFFYRKFKEKYHVLPGDFRKLERKAHMGAAFNPQP